MSTQRWPSLPLAQWRDTCATLHLWTQIVGKIRLALTPLVNHWWNVPFYVSTCGLTTSPMPCGDRLVEIEFDLLSHRLRINVSDSAHVALPLHAQSVADFYRELMQALRGLGVDVKIWPMPVEVGGPWSEIQEPLPFDQDSVHKSYDAQHANRFWRVLVFIDNVFKRFRTRFIGKVSPVHFFWGSFDHAVTRFSGRRAPLDDGADRVTAEGYSHEVISHGFWPGGIDIDAAFYSYTAPAPAGLCDAKIKPDAAFYSRDLEQFVLPYDAVWRSSSPEDMLIDFLQSTYEAGAALAKWDRAALERTPPAR